MILARICVVWSKSPLGAMLILETPESTPYFCGYIFFLDNGDPTFLFNISNLHIITFTKNLISEIS